VTRTCNDDEYVGRAALWTGSADGDPGHPDYVSVADRGQMPWGRVATDIDPVLLQPSEIYFTLARICTHVAVTSASGVRQACAVCHVLVAMLETGIVTEPTIFACLGPLRPHVGMLGEVVAGAVHTHCSNLVPVVAGSRTTTTKVSPTVKVPGTEVTAYKSTLIAGLNNAPKTSADRQQRYQNLLDACKHAPTHRPSHKVTALEHVAWAVALGDDVAVRTARGNGPRSELSLPTNLRHRNKALADMQTDDVQVGRVLRIRKKFDSGYCEYIHPVSLAEGERDDKVCLQLAWYSELTQGGTNYLVANDGNATDLCDIDIHTVICPVDLEPAPDHQGRFTLGQDYREAIAANPRGDLIEPRLHEKAPDSHVIITRTVGVRGVVRLLNRSIHHLARPPVKNYEILIL
jgi:hypothetical protein